MIIRLLKDLLFEPIENMLVYRNQLDSSLKRSQLSFNVNCWKLLKFDVKLFFYPNNLDCYDD